MVRHRVLVHILALLLGIQTLVAAMDVHDLHLNTEDHHQLSAQDAAHQDLSLFNAVPDFSAQDTADNAECEHCCHCHGGHAAYVISQSSSIESPFLTSFGYADSLSIDKRFNSALFRPPIV